MSDSAIYNQPQFLTQQWAASTSADSSWGGIGSTSAAKSANPEKLALAFLARMSEPGTGNYGTGATQGVKNVHGTHGTHNTQGAQFRGQTFAATMPPPTAPKVQFTSATQANYQSFAAESKAAMQNVGTWAQQQPELQKTTDPLKPGSTAEQAAAAASTWFGGTANGGPALANGSLLAFMKLRIENTDSAINALQQMAESSSDLQSSMAQQEAAASKAAEAEAQKSNKKSGILGLFQKIFAVVLAVVCVVAAFLTCDPALAVAGLAIAMMAFVVAGAVKGKGKGFDFWGGLDWFTNTIGIVDGAMLLKGLAKAAISEGVKEGLKSALKVGLKSAAETGSSVIGKTATNAIADFSSQAARQMRKQVEKSIQYIEASSKKLTEILGGKGNAVAEGAKITGDAGKTGATTAKGTGVATKEGDVAVGDGAAAGGGEGGGAAEDGSEAAKAAAKAKGKEAATRMKVMGAVIGVAQGADEIGTGIIQLQISQHQANADAHLADIECLKAMVRMLDSNYKTANDLVQTLIKSHSNGVDATQSMLKSNQDVANLISSNMAQI